jgi:hypothetical protein
LATTGAQGPWGNTGKTIRRTSPITSLTSVEAIERNKPKEVCAGEDLDYSQELATVCTLKREHPGGVVHAVDGLGDDFRCYDCVAHIAQVERSAVVVLDGVQHAETCVGAYRVHRVEVVPRHVDYAINQFWIIHAVEGYPLASVGHGEQIQCA